MFLGKKSFELQELSQDDMRAINGGLWFHIAIMIAIYFLGGRGGNSPQL